MANFDNKWIEIFRAGDYGGKGDWPANRVRQVAENFAAGIWKPVLTPPQAQIGHRDDVPALGQVSALKEENGVLFAQFEKVHPALEQLVKDGRFPNRSAGMYVDPEGRGPMLRHVAFLGSMPPEIKGLQPIHFSDGEFVAIDFKEEETVDPNEIKKTVGEGIKAWFAEHFGGEPDPARAAATFTEEQVEEKVTAATSPLIASITQLRKDFDDEKTASVTRAREAASVSGKQRVANFVEKMKAANRWIPAFDEMGIPIVLETLASNGAAVKFGEAGKEVDTPVEKLMTNFIESLGAIVPKGALVDDSKQFADAGGPHAVALKAREYADGEKAKGNIVSVADAVDHVLAR
jgi:hypothetical protein